MPITSGVLSPLLISGICVIAGVSAAGIAYALSNGMELLGRLCAVVGISLVLTLLLLVLYQDDTVQAQQPVASPTISQSVAAATPGTP